MRAIVKLNAVIANGASLSGAVDVSLRGVVGLLIPAQWTSAKITFAVSWDGGATHLPLHDLGSTLYEIAAASVPTAESVVIALDPLKFLGAASVKIQSGTVASATAQGAERTIGVLVRDLGD